MNHVVARIAAAAALTATAGVLLTTVSVFAAESPGNNGNHFGQISNPGHHYGQLKHGPTPTPTQTPPPPASQPPAAGPTPAGHPSGGGAPADPAPAKNASESNLPVTLPVNSVHSGRVNAIRSAANHDWWSWLILLILPLLIAVWLWLFARVALTGARLRRKAAPAV